MSHSPSISIASLICASRPQRATAMRDIPRAIQRPDVSAFQRRMDRPYRRDLEQGEILELPTGLATVVCLGGELWLTRDGDIRDYILGAGSCMHLDARDQTTVQALKASRLRLISA